MSILAIRHGLSEANNRHNAGTLAFANGEAPLMKLGRQQARELGRLLTCERHILPAFTPVAASRLRRTGETAQEAGFKDIRRYASLNEVAHGIPLPGLREMLADGILPDVALETAKSVLRDPPQETIWFTHGLVIAGLCRMLDVHQEARLIPKFCEVRELPI